MIELATQRPDARLAPYIKMYYWGKDDNAPKVQRIVPNGEMGLHFYRGSSVWYDGVGERRSCIAGQGLSFQDIVSDGHIEIVGVHFTTLGAHMFFKPPLNEFYGKTIEVNELRDTSINELEDRIGSAKTPEECWTIFDRYFYERIEHSDKDILNIRRLQRALAYGQSNISEATIDRIAGEACISQRHFGRVFSEIVGMPPKEYMRLMRYHQTLRELKKRRDTSTMTDIAIDNGYCDFSHLSTDFKKISGYTPTELLKKSVNDGDDVGWRI